MSRAPQPARGRAVLALAALLALCGCSGGPGGHAPDQAAAGQESSGSGLSPAERERRRTFWRLFEQADALRREGQWLDAVPVYQAALEADPKHEGALYGLANCLLELDRHAEAKDALERLVLSNPLSQRAHVQLGYLLSCPTATCCFDLAAAQRELERAVDINREESGAQLRLAEVLLARGDRARAVETLGKVQRANTHSVEAPWLLAWIAHDEGRRDDAAALLAEAAARDRGPALPSAVPAEGDTRGDHRLVESTLPGKGLVPPAWQDVGARVGEGAPTAAQADAELARLDAGFLSR